MQRGNSEFGGASKLGITLFLGLVTLGPALDAADPSFSDTFDFNPAGLPPKPLLQGLEPTIASRWDITVHDRQHPNEFGDQLHLDPVHAHHHGGGCAGYPSTHQLETRDDAVFVCNDHVMTAINGSSYALIALTPNRLVDFSQGEAVVSFDMSTVNTASPGRDWMDVFISAYDEHLQTPAFSFVPDVHGPPRNGLMIASQGLEPFGLKAFQLSDFSERELGAFRAGFLTPSATRRDTIVLRISRTRLQVSMPAYSERALIDTPLSPPLPFERAVVQFGHHSYDPLKDCPGSCAPNTWHFDNFAISPAVPFTMIKPNKMSVLSATDEVTFDAPAPANAHLRFQGYSGMSRGGMHVSFDGGASWQKARLQSRSTGPDEDHHFNGYWHPIPAGVRAVRFRGDKSAYGGNPGWVARAFSIWSLETMPQLEGCN